MPVNGQSPHNSDDIFDELFAQIAVHDLSIHSITVGKIRSQKI